MVEDKQYMVSRKEVKLKDMKTRDLCIYDGWICKLLPESERSNIRGIRSQFQGICNLLHDKHKKDFKNYYPDINIKDIPELKEDFDAQ